MSSAVPVVSYALHPLLLPSLPSAVLVSEPSTNWQQAQFPRAQLLTFNPASQISRFNIPHSTHPPHLPHPADAKRQLAEAQAAQEEEVAGLREAGDAASARASEAASRAVQARRLHAEFLATLVRVYRYIVR